MNGTGDEEFVGAPGGHASVTLTLDTYSHVLPSMQQAASEKMESILFEKTGAQLVALPFRVISVTHVFFILFSCTSE